MKRPSLLFLLAGLTILGLAVFLAFARPTDGRRQQDEGLSAINSGLPDNPNLGIDYSQSELREIWLAGGCFWGVQAYLDRLPGVAETSVGYANGKTENPSYHDVIYRQSGHAETVHVRYDPERISLQELLDHFFLIIDPTSLNRQGPDIGSQYRAGIYYSDPQDQQDIEQVITREQEKYEKEIVVEVIPLIHYYLAEEEHQKYLEKNPGGYCHVSFDTLPEWSDQQDGSGLVDPDLYSRPDNATIREMLSAEAYYITQEDGTERAFSGQYDQHYEAGIYVDIVTGEPLFTSLDKYNSGSGWPSFTRPVDPAVVRQVEDLSFGLLRIEARSRVGDSHLGHVFNDGPREAGGLRYCINSAALRFIALDEMETAGYSYLLPLFQQEQDMP